MKRRWLILLLAVPVIAGAEEDPLREARAALNEGLPAVAEQKIRALSPQEQSGALLLLGQALLAKGEPAAALEAVRPLAEEGRVSLVIGRASAALGQWDEALTAFQAAEKEPEVQDAAVMGEVGALEALGRFAEAIEVLRRARTEQEADAETGLLLARLLMEIGELKEGREVLNGIEAQSPVERKWAAYLQGKAQLAEGEVEEALATFESVLAAPEGLSESLRAGATIGLARAQSQLGASDAGASVLEDFINENASGPWLDPAFTLLDELYAARQGPVPSLLKKWTQGAPSERTALALLHLAAAEVREKDTGRAIKLLETFTDDYPKHPRIGSAASQAARLLIERREYDDALVLLERGMAGERVTLKLAALEMLRGAVYFRQGMFEAAAQQFRSAGRRSPRIREQAIFNAALAWLQLGSSEEFLADYREMSAQFPESDLRRELVLEEGLLQLGAGNPKAAETLRRFVSDFPGNRRVPEAQLALAEQAYLSSDGAAASQYLRVVNETASGETADRAACLALFVKSDDPDVAPEEVIAGAIDFIRTRPASPLIPEVRMKLAEVYFQQGDYGNARTQFEIVAKEHPQSGYAPAALFLAGQAAARSMNPDRALELFDEVARRDGPFKLYARQEQAALKRRLGQDAEAVILYDRVLSGEPDAELRHAALAGKGLSLAAQGKEDPKQLEQAVAVFDELARLPNVTPFWRNQALYRKGRALQSKGSEAEALTAFYDVLAQSTAETADAETFWFYKAGFEAAQMLEARSDWKGAIAVYEKMAQLEGPRKAEVQARIDRLRLEHFIWEE